jgi:hypothetical protein
MERTMKEERVTFNNETDAQDAFCLLEDEGFTVHIEDDVTVVYMVEDRHD